MIDIDKLTKQFAGHVSFQPIGNAVFQIKAPFFHADGDMMDLFLRETNGTLELCDFGTSLMRLSYTFDLDTENKTKIFDKIITGSGVNFENGNIYLPSTYDSFFVDLMQFQSAITKVTNLDILRREQIASLFIESFASFITDELGSQYKHIEQNYQPTGEDSYIADFAILDKPEHPVFLLGIKDNLNAARAAALCNRLVAQKKVHTSIAVHENADALSRRDRNLLTNSVDKQFSSLEDFKNGASTFISRQIA